MVYDNGRLKASGGSTSLCNTAQEVSHSGLFTHIQTTNDYLT